jgi:hypothetical protein
LSRHQKGDAFELIRIRLGVESKRSTRQQILERWLKQIEQPLFEKNGCRLKAASDEQAEKPLPVCYSKFEIRNLSEFLISDLRVQILNLARLPIESGWEIANLGSTPVSSVLPTSETKEDSSPA